VELEPQPKYVAEPALKQALPVDNGPFSGDLATLHEPGMATRNAYSQHHLFTEKDTLDEKPFALAQRTEGIGSSGVSAAAAPEVHPGWWTPS
jgi:hypothetical protein